MVWIGVQGVWSDPAVNTDHCDSDDEKTTGKPDAGKPHVRFDEGALMSATAFRARSSRVRRGVYERSGCLQSLVLYSTVDQYRDIPFKIAISWLVDRKNAPMKLLHLKFLT